MERRTLTACMKCNTLYKPSPNQLCRLKCESCAKPLLGHYDIKCKRCQKIFCDNFYKTVKCPFCARAPPSNPRRGQRRNHATNGRYNSSGNRRGAQPSHRDINSTPVCVDLVSSSDASDSETDTDNSCDSSDSLAEQTSPSDDSQPPARAAGGERSNPHSSPHSSPSPLPQSTISSGCITSSTVASRSSESAREGELGLPKSEIVSKNINQLIALRPKTFSFTTQDGEHTCKRKGVPYHLQEKLSHDSFEHTLETNTSIRFVSRSIRNVQGMICTCRGLSAFDDKCYNLSPTQSQAYGHPDIPNNNDDDDMDIEVGEEEIGGIEEVFMENGEVDQPQRLFPVFRPWCK
ncbi:uncharacterized protein [Procambarus clarkii]|uniref:uncharacterized protein n=1 Tax=Procambarus clarkii TaxID=6728 RepID=UPI003741F8CD